MISKGGREGIMINLEHYIIAQSKKVLKINMCLKKVLNKINNGMFKRNPVQLDRTLTGQIWDKLNIKMNNDSDGL